MMTNDLIFENGGAFDAGVYDRIEDMPTDEIAVPAVDVKEAA